jgi:hypothetical protein
MSGFVNIDDALLRGGFLVYVCDVTHPIYPIQQQQIALPSKSEFRLYD